MAGNLHVSWGGTPPFFLSAERIIIVNKERVIKPVFGFKTENNAENVVVNFATCTQFKVCNVLGCADLPRQKIILNKVVLCSPTK